MPKKITVAEKNKALKVISNYTKQEASVGLKKGKKLTRAAVVSAQKKILKIKSMFKK